jgi:hypothetical protein
MAKNSFNLSLDYKEIVDDLSDKQAGILLKAIYHYIAEGELMAGLEDKELAMAFKFIKRDLDYSQSKYEEICLKNSENGKKGGAPTGNQNAEKTSERLKNNRNNRNNPKQANGLKNNPNDTDIDNDIDIDKDKDNDSCSEQSQAISSQPPTSPPSELAELPFYAADKRLCSRWREVYPAWQKAYPAVDIIAEVRKAYAWETANPKRKKTDRCKFLNSWLARTQDASSRNKASPPTKFKSKFEKDNDFYEDFLKKKQQEENIKNGNAT